MQFTIDTIYTFKLTSGEEIVAKVVQVQDNTIIISEPVSVVQSQQGIGLLPTFFTADPSKKPLLNINNIMLSSPTDASVSAKYIEATSGIKIAPKKLILG